jgi:hypothetical protein
MKKLLLFVSVFTALVAAAVYFIQDKAGFEVKVKNETGVFVKGLFLTYNNIETDIEIPPIEANEEISVRVEPTEEFGENSMDMYYKDNSGVIHKETVIGYFEQGYSGAAVVTLNSINGNGILDVVVDEKMY